MHDRALERMDFSLVHLLVVWDGVRLVTILNIVVTSYVQFVWSRSSFWYYIGEATKFISAPPNKDERYW